MSDQVTNVEIEDVLSSIRRLVAEGEKPRGARSDTGDSRSAGTGDRLLLTPALRVRSDAPQDMDALPDHGAMSPADGRDDPVTLPDDVLVLTPAAARQEPAADVKETADEDRPQVDRASLEATIAELEAAVTAQTDEWEPDGTGTDITPSWDSAGFNVGAENAGSKATAVDDADADAEPTLPQSLRFGHRDRAERALGDEAMRDRLEGVRLHDMADTPARPTAERPARKLHLTNPIVPGARDQSALADALAVDAEDKTAPDETGARREAEDVPTPPSDDDAGDAQSLAGTDQAATLAVDRLAAAVAAAGGGLALGSQVAEQEETVDDAAPPETMSDPWDVSEYTDVAEAVDPASNADPETDSMPADHMSADTDYDEGEASGQDVPLGSAAPEVSDIAEDSAAAGSQDIAGLSEAALRALVTEVLREELQGKLGERITRNVRKLVRREIHRVLTAQELE